MKKLKERLLQVFSKYITEEEFEDLLLSINALYDEHTYPKDKKDIFNAFKSINIDKVNVIIIHTHKVENTSLGWVGDIQDAAHRVHNPEVWIDDSTGDPYVLPPLEYIESLRKQGIVFLDIPMTIGKDVEAHRDLWYPFIEKILFKLHLESPDILLTFVGDSVDGMSRTMSGRTLWDRHFSESIIKGIDGILKDLNKESIKWV